MALGLNLFRFYFMYAAAIWLRRTVYSGDTMIYALILFLLLLLAAQILKLFYCRNLFHSRRPPHSHSARIVSTLSLIHISEPTRLL